MDPDSCDEVEPADARSRDAVARSYTELPYRDSMLAGSVFAGRLISRTKSRLPATACIAALHRLYARSFHTRTLVSDREKSGRRPPVAQGTDPETSLSVEANRKGTLNGSA